MRKIILVGSTNSWISPFTLEELKEELRKASFGVESADSLAEAVKKEPADWYFIWSSDQAAGDIPRYSELGYKRIYFKQSASHVTPMGRYYVLHGSKYSTAAQLVSAILKLGN